MMTQTFGVGMSMGVPDVAMTPPLAIPAPFPNIAQNAMAIPTCPTVMINGMPELTLGSQVALTSGDEAGTMGGVASGTIMGMSRNLMGSQANFVCGMPSTRSLDPTIQNLTNAPGVTTVPSQTVKTVLR